MSAMVKVTSSGTATGAATPDDSEGDGQHSQRHRSNGELPMACVQTA